MTIPQDPAITTMLARATQCLQHAYCHYSKFPVGACLRSESGQLFSGCNVENLSYSLTLCAEASALAALIASGERTITEILIIANSELPCPPCGSCRQRLIEFAKPDTLVHLCSQQGGYQVTTIGELLPLSFDKTVFNPS